MNAIQHSTIVSFVWNIADDVLRDLYVRGKYRDVILPMTVLRRLDAVLEPTKNDVLEMKAALDKAKVDNQDAPLRQAAGQAFYNTSKFTLKDLRHRASQQKLKADFPSDAIRPSVAGRDEQGRSGSRLLPACLPAVGARGAADQLVRAEPSPPGSFVTPSTQGRSSQ
jgi:hypothetical protein